MRLYGSCMTGFGLQSSTLNLDLQIPDTVAPHKALIEASNAIEASNLFRCVVGKCTSENLNRLKNATIIF